MNVKSCLKFGISYGMLSGIVLGSGFINLWIDFSSYPLLYPFTLLTLIIALIMGLILFIIQLNMVIKKKIMVKEFLFSLGISIVGSGLFFNIWMAGVECVSFLKEKYQIFY